MEAFLDCPQCSEVVPGSWPDDDVPGQDMTDAPEAEQACTSCGHRWVEQSPHWSFFTEAG